MQAWEPAPRLRQRFRAVAAWIDATPVELAGLSILLLSGCAVAATVLWLSVPRPASPGDGAPTPGEPSATSASSQAGSGTVAADPTPPAAEARSAATGRVTVHVAGAVATPGIVVLDTGSRVAEAVAAAGGATVDADTAAVNLARVVSDGEQIRVPRVGEVVAPPPGAPASPSQPIDLNRASVDDLVSLPGIGPVLAERIVAWREQHGGFATIEQLAEVPGIGERRLEELRPRVAVR